MALKKNTSQGIKNTELLAVFQAHFSGHLNLARIRLICLFITALCKVRSVNYSKLAGGFDTDCSPDSSFRRIQRFMAQVDLPMKLVAGLIFALLPNKENLVLVLDRTNWKLGSSNINILMLGVSYKNVAFPLMFKMLDKRGNSHTKERIGLIKNFIDWFGKDCIDCLLADREFVGRDWMDYLNREQIRYHIRIRDNFWIFSPKKGKQVKAQHLFNHLRVGGLYHSPNIVQLKGEYCYLSGMKVVVKGRLEFLILVSFNRPEGAIEYYRQRWQVETLFRALKTSGFNIEDTHVTDLSRLKNLILLTMIAFVWCYRIGDFIDTNIRPIKIKKHGRRAVSVFKYGLDYLASTLITGRNKLNLCLLEFLSCT